MICEKCGACMEYFEEGSSCGQRCPECGWGVVTTKPNPLFEDTAVYAVSLLSGNEVNGETLKAISRACGVNYLAAKDIVEKPDNPIFTGKAWEVLEKKLILDEGNVAYEITPEFVHTSFNGVRWAL